MLETKGEALRAAQDFLKKLFEGAALDAMLVPVHTGSIVRPTVVTTADGLGQANMFAPLMVDNSARPLARYMSDNPDKRIGAVLRACEIRALMELSTRRLIALGNVLVIGVDCLGTFSEDDFAWRGSVSKLTQEALQFARQGGAVVYRYRPACQMCTDPMPDRADLTIDLLGLPVRHRLMVTVHSDSLAGRLDMAALTDGAAPSELIEQHARMRARMAARRDRARERITHALSTDLAMTVDQLVDHLAECDPCQTCLETCPILSSLGPELPLTRDAVTGWLMSCAGCGMCEQSCPEHLPLVSIFTRIRQEIINVLDGDGPAEGSLHTP
jgi:formate dehydrogenase subunit beta